MEPLSYKTISENSRLRCEAYNVLNHPVFAATNTAFGTIPVERTVRAHSNWEHGSFLVARKIVTPLTAALVWPTVRPGTGRPVRRPKVCDSHAKEETACRRP